MASTPGSPPYPLRLSLIFLSISLLPLLFLAMLNRFDDLDPAPHPPEAMNRVPIPVRKHFDRIVQVTERIGDGLVHGPEDLAYDAESGVVYTSCADGWIRRVKLVGDSAVEDWVRVGGRPLGLALRPDKGALFVAEAYKGLIQVTMEGQIELLTDEAEGVKFKIVDGIDVAEDGMIYFTDASYKYNLNDYTLDILEGRPHGRLMSFDPSTNQTRVLLRDLYFANGVSLSPEQDFFVFCETFVRRCRKYYIKGEKKGMVEKFVENLPGYPDNIRYAEGLFWIGSPSGKNLFYDTLFRYPLLRKIMGIVGKFYQASNLETGSGVMAVNLDGEVVARYSDPGLGQVTGGIRIGNYLYYGSFFAPYIGRLNLNQEGAPVSAAAA